ncbi:MAG: hypothetical protein RL117_356 [Verrucomicrobiota bacterium]|jgi:hypothetical protein
MIARYLIIPVYLFSVAALVASEKVEFNRDVRPILSQNCFACHGFDAKTREADLRLDVRESAMGRGESGKKAIVPGDVEASEVWHRINSKDPDDIMPPPKHHAPLGPKEVDVIRRWIEQGAEYQGHWAFEKPIKPAVPTVKVDGGNEIDAFILEKLNEKKLSFAPEADRATLIRRLSFDLIGLPPTPEQVQAFAADASPNAYEALVDRLLAMPEFGERMAMPWLDAARYADTNGYSIDGGRHAWLWRDWVIKAFHDNMPYDQFLAKQLAGDLMPNATDADRIATAFNRNHSITHEGGTIPEENLTNYAADRVKTYGEAMIGLTLACAQCHDHKYDPIKQKDYYQIFAFFNRLDDKGLDGDGGRNSQPTIDAMTPLSNPAEAEQVKADLAAAEAELAKPRPEAQAAWEKQQVEAHAQSGKDFATAACQLLAATTPNGSPDSLRITPDSALEIHGGSYAAYTVSSKLPESMKTVHGVRVVFEPAAHAGNTLGYSEGTFVMTTVNLAATSFQAGNVDPNSPLPLRRITASDQRPGFPVSAVWSSDTATGWSPPGGSQPQHLTLTFAKPLDASQFPYLTAELVFNHGGASNPGRLRLEAFVGETNDSDLPADVWAAVQIPVDQRSPEQAARVQAHFRDFSTDCAQARYRVANLRERLSVLTEKHSVLVMNESANPRKTHILERGVYSSPLEEVQPDTPGFLPRLAKNAPLSRLDLAEWTVSRENPLTSRVAVNRFWELAFGRGLSTSTADFGSQGVWPTHPELLDWLAVSFMESGWNVKQMLKTILMSRTYRQSSRTTAEMLRVDPLNEWYARGPRFRLSAESIRDQALAISGLLVQRIGGPSVKIYQPGDLWRAVSHYGSTPATSQTFVQDHGEKLYRRSLYTYWKRTLPPTNLATFDAPNREVCTVGRSNTNTPLQALVLLNDPQFVEAARHFAIRMLQLQGDDATRLRYGFRAVTAREPSDQEMTLLTQALQQEMAKFSGQSAMAQSYLNTGESGIDPRYPVEQQAAWSALAQILFNLSETITRN